MSLIYLPDGGSLVRIRKIGYAAQTIFVSISPADTTPLTIVLARAAQRLPAIVTYDSAERHLSPALRGFEERRREGFGGHFIDETELRRNPGATLSLLLPRFAGGMMKGGTFVSTRKASSGPAFEGSVNGGCKVTVYLDGVLFYSYRMAGASPPDFTHLYADDYAGIEFYAGAGTFPAWVSPSNNDCGVLLLWTRER